ncbi:MAG: hypothetical protein P8Q48_05560 [Paracoccaceae bacterium]|nr:hypothetical protein [Paracoccaceae bacterium]MDG1369697.1 hypothetical protein [Paracoccaceae bacterium]
MKQCTVAAGDIAKPPGDMRAFTIFIVHPEEIARAAIFLDRLHFAVNFMMYGRQRLGKPAVILVGMLGLPIVQQAGQTVHLALLETAVKQPAPDFFEKEFSVDL